MPDWKHEVLRRLNDPVLARQPEVIEELAEHVEQRYRALIAAGRAESEAISEALDELSDPAALARELRRIVPGPPVAPEIEPAEHRSVLGRLRQDPGTACGSCARTRGLRQSLSWRWRSGPAPTPRSFRSSTR
jgi:hypothetical protein